MTFEESLQKYRNKMFQLTTMLTAYERERHELRIKVDSLKSFIRCIELMDGIDSTWEKRGNIVDFLEETQLNEPEPQ